MRRAVLGLVVAACGPQPIKPYALPGGEPGTAHAAADPAAVPVGPPPVIPTGTGCLTERDTASVLAGLHKSIEPGHDPRLVAAECQKHVYLAGTARFVIWGVAGAIHGKASSRTSPLPSAACIERGLARSHELFPLANPILRRERARSPELWRDPDVGAVSYLECDARGEPGFLAMETMLHEVNHRQEHDDCIYDPFGDRDICFALDAKLPPGTIAAYPGTPSGLDADSAEVFRDVQRQYLVQNEDGLRDLLDEVMAYAVSCEAFTVGRARRIYPPPNGTHYNNLPLLMALSARFLGQVAIAPAARTQIAAILERGEAAYARWLAVSAPRSYERVFWSEYQRARAAWDRTR